MPEEENKSTSKSGVRVKLTGTDGNAFAILARVRRELIRAGQPKLAKEFMDEATTGTYEHLLATAMEYVDVI